MIDAPLEELMEVDDVGPVVASHIRAFFEVKCNREVIVDLVTLGVHWSVYESNIDSNCSTWLGRLGCLLVH